MVIKHSPVKHTIFLLLALWYEGFFIYSLYNYLTSTSPSKDGGFFFFSLVMAAAGLVFIIRCIRRLFLDSTIISIDRQGITYHFSGFLTSKTYRIPLQSIVRARYNQDTDESEISLWLDKDFHQYENFHHPRHHIYAYPDSRLISLVFKRKRLKELENLGLDKLIYQYQQGGPTTDQPAASVDETKPNTDGDSVFF